VAVPPMLQRRPTTREVGTAHAPSGTTVRDMQLPLLLLLLLDQAAF